MASFYPFPTGIVAAELRDFGARMREAIEPEDLSPEAIVDAAGGTLVRRPFALDADGPVVLARITPEAPFEMTLPDRPVHGASFIAARTVGHAFLHCSPVLQAFDPHPEVIVPLYPEPGHLGHGPGIEVMCLDIAAAIEEAHDFAFGFLMPEPAFRRAWGGIRRIPAAAAKLGVTPLDVASCAIRLGLAAEDDPAIWPFIEAPEQA